MPKIFPRRFGITVYGVPWDVQERFPRLVLKPPAGKAEKQKALPAPADKAEVVEDGNG